MRQGSSLIDSHAFLRMLLGSREFSPLFDEDHRIVGALVHTLGNDSQTLESSPDRSDRQGFAPGYYISLFDNGSVRQHASDVVVILELQNRLSKMHGWMADVRLDPPAERLLNVLFRLRLARFMTMNGHVQAALEDARELLKTAIRMDSEMEWPG